MKKITQNLFFILVCLSSTAALYVFKDLLFPYVTSKAFFFRICIEAALPLYCYLIAVDKKLRPNLKNPLNILLLVFLAINIITAFTGVNVVRSLWGNFERMGGAFYLTNLVALYFYVLLLGQMGDKYLKRYILFFFAVALVITINGIFGKLGWPTLVADPSLPVRVSSTLGNPIYLGSFLVVPLFLAIFFGLQSETWFGKISYYICALLFLIGILLSGTRGAMVGLVAGGFLAGVVYLFFTPKRAVKIYGGAVAVLFVGAYALISVFNSHLPAGSDFKRLFNLDDSNTKSRLIQWGTALQGFKDYPLLGVGSENYYIIANKYYNPKIFQYDRSWFDKPHNYVLEILVTNGIFGLLAYLGIIGYCIYSFYKGYKAGFYGAGEFGVLLAGMLVYQIQNLTVFDTVPASLTFFSFLGFAAYIGYQADQPKKSAAKTNGFSQPFAWAVLAVSVPVMAYAIYATNIVPMTIAKRVNYGFAYASVDPAKADQYFQQAISLPFNFDKDQTASKYADFAQGVARSGGQNQAQAIKTLGEATTYMEATVKEVPNDPILWQRLSSLYLFNSIQLAGKVVVNPMAVDALNKAIALAPDREENFIAQAQIKTLGGDFPAAEDIVSQAIQKFPTDAALVNQLGQIYHYQGKNDLAAQIVQLAVSKGYTFNGVGEISWLVGYYSNNKQYDKAIALQEQAVKLDPNNVQQFVTLANLYQLVGRKDEALNLAEEIIQVDPSQAKALQTILATSTAASVKK